MSYMKTRKPIVQTFTQEEWVEKYINFPKNIFEFQGRVFRFKEVRELENGQEELVWRDTDKNELVIVCEEE